MRLTLAVLALSVAGTALAGQADGLGAAASDVKGLVGRMRQAPAPDQPGFNAVAVTGIWVETDCEKITFEENGPAVSKPVELFSRTWLEDCDYIPIPHGGSVCIPRRHVISYDQKTVTVVLKDRPVPGGPKEVFEACLWGRQVSLRVKSSPNKYDVAEKDGVFTLTKKQ